ncbi:RsmB/NOP family class I SAM-dependent RNA methyltransferase [Salinarchaeum sp. IM2453]|uniref:RsmB/NOP family class I SAM-dependent RNA methyltransferase n=1 Tax=Salinarchaeum sp. IM2453 TaxID=2862870 RepID=UPI001C82FEB1|nr:RsmB/NOP family class I SAM-dependent RNA methyltransferase [Salinarchaeum sp. IM2453]QZA89004.1 RsmB/NOP family class I SAM-dependent RNA methyltransferase [Salinarchaeum sp. IM2453]
MEALERYRSIIDDFDAFMEACNRPLPAVIRTNTIKATPQQVQTVLDQQEITYEQVAWNNRLFRLSDVSAGSVLPSFLGWTHGQEEVSAIPAQVLDPDPETVVFDSCAAPGSKTTQLAALMDDRGRVVANDNNLGRLSALRFNSERLGVTNLAVTHSDARNFSLKPFDFEQFDSALVDVPCSCEGTIRKNPDAIDDWSLDQVTGIAGVQKGVLRRAVQATRPGGRVVYSTCTFAPEENEAVLDHVLANEPCRIVEQELPINHTHGITEWEDQEYDPAVQQAARIYPHHNDTGGFFCATLEVTA